MRLPDVAPSHKLKGEMDRDRGVAGAHSWLNKDINSGALVDVLCDFILDPFAYGVADSLRSGYHCIGNVRMADDALVADSEISQRRRQQYVYLERAYAR